MIHIVTLSNRGLYAAQLAEMHEIRRLNFGTSLGRAYKDGPEGRDQFDDVHAVYVMALDSLGAVKCSARLRPVVGQSVTEAIYGDFIDAQERPIGGADAWDMGRLCLPPEAGEGVHRLPEVLLAAMEHAAREGATRLVGMSTVVLYEGLVEANVNTRLLGPKADLGGYPALAVEASILPDDIAAYRRGIGRVGWAGYEIDEDDLTHCGSLRAVERAFDRACSAPIMQPEPRAEAIAEVERAFRRWG